MDALESLTTISRQGNGAHRDPDKPAAHVSDYLALLPSGPDAVRRLKLHRVRAAVRLATTEQTARSLSRRDVRVVEGARLESVCRGNSTVGSNPTLSAICLARSERDGGCGTLMSLARIPGIRYKSIAHPSNG